MSHNTSTELAHTAPRKTPTKASRRLAVSAALATALLGAGAGAALAAQGATLGSGQSASFQTYFWGRTVVCFHNIGASSSTYEWWSSSTYGKNTLNPGQTNCENRSFAGFNIKVQNNGPASLQVSFPYGP